MLKLLHAIILSVQRSTEAKISACNYYSPEGEYWKYSTGQKNSVDALGYNSAESEPICIKSGTMCAIPAVATVWQGAEFFSIISPISRRTNFYDI